MGIRESHILKDAVKIAEIAKEAVGTQELADGAVTKLKVSLSGTVSIDPPSIGAGLYANVDVTVTGLATADRILVTPPVDIEDGLRFVGASIPAVNTLRIRLHNTTGVAIDGAARTWTWATLR